MSYKSRERKRQVKVETRKMVQAARAKHSPDTATRYFLRVVKHDCRCVACGGHLRRGAEMVYRHHGAVKLCVGCAERDPLVSYVPSAHWEASRRAEVRKRAEKASRQVWD